MLAQWKGYEAFCPIFLSGESRILAAMLSARPVSPASNCKRLWVENGPRSEGHVSRNCPALSAAPCMPRCTCRMHKS